MKFVPVKAPYVLVCVMLGVALGWIPVLLHGPIPEKFNLYYIHGSIAVWAFYSARMMIGFVVGVSVWPRRWYLRGPLWGCLTMLPVTFFSLAVPECGPGCMAQNLLTASGIGCLVAGLAFLVTGKHHA